MKIHIRYILLVWLFLALIVAIFAVSGIKMAHISRDPAQLLDSPVYIGLLSNIGILIWAAACAVTLFTAYLLPPSKNRNVLIWSGILTSVLLLDDFFLLHDRIVPQYLHLSDFWFYLLYLISFGYFFLRYGRFLIATTPYKLLMLGFFLFGSSMLIDFELVPGGIDVEDSFKICGMAAYSYFWLITSGRYLRQICQTPAS